MSSLPTDGALERLAAALERIANGVESMAQSIRTIALQFIARPNQNPVWTLPERLVFEEGTPKTVLASQFVTDPDPEYPGAKPLEIDILSANAQLAAMGIQVTDLGRDVEIRYDGRVVGAQPEEPVDLDNALVLAADDGVPDQKVSVGGETGNGSVAGGK